MPQAYEAHRIALGVPRGGIDFMYGDTFPHEADMDQLGGVDFDKGCYVGQEVVSRMEHRGSARTRVVPVVYDGSTPMPGLPVMAGDRAGRHARLGGAGPRACAAAARPRRGCAGRRHATLGRRHSDPAGASRTGRPLPGPASKTAE